MTKIKSRQSLIDIAIQETGSELTAFEWAVANDISVTAELVPGSDLKAPVSDTGNLDIKRYFSGKSKKIATGATPEQIDMIANNDGIGYMTIDDDFIVN